jgi:hypothetical protein
MNLARVAGFFVPVFVLRLRRFSPATFIHFTALVPCTSQRRCVGGLGHNVTRRTHLTCSLCFSQEEETISYGIAWYSLHDVKHTAAPQKASGSLHPVETRHVAVPGQNSSTSRKGEKDNVDPPSPHITYREE